MLKDISGMVLEEFGNFLGVDTIIEVVLSSKDFLVGFWNSKYYWFKTSARSN